MVSRKILYFYKSFGVTTFLWLRCLYGVFMVRLSSQSMTSSLCDSDSTWLWSRRRAFEWHLLDVVFQFDQS